MLPEYFMLKEKIGISKDFTFEKFLSKLYISAIVNIFDHYGEYNIDIGDNLK